MFPLFKKIAAGWQKCVPQRYVIALLCFMAMVMCYIHRFCLSLAITAMAESKHHIIASASQCGPKPNQTLSSSAVLLTAETYEFDWDEEIQGMILSAFFWGYVLSQIPGGVLADRYGGKKTLGFGMGLSITCTLLTPYFARTFGHRGMVLIRFILGLGQGPVYPSVNTLLAQWVPPTERGRMGAFVFAGAMIGNVVSMALSGVIIRYIRGGWASLFLIYGGAGIVWLVLWHIFAYNDPLSNPYMSDKEREYLEKNTGGLQRNKDLPATPWRRIFTSGPVWGLIVAQIGHDWGLFTIITDLPKYMKSVLHFSITQNGALSALPYIVMWFAALMSGGIVDYLIKPDRLSTTTVRKIFVTIASAGPAIGILAASYSGCDKLLAMISFTFGMGLMGAFVPSLKVNALDLSPNYAGTLMAVVGGIGAMSGILTPYLVGVLTPDGTLEEWRTVFWLSSIVLIITNIIYVALGSGEIQPWN
ncbi:putative inorganic phosphate cotransporter isoform X2 [Bemisia tabaci]|uniref:putative inorganic phosphate cotransporter isoform X2 n=1 Tax=Bemisia tabaci TaxID=7038 RepID=UPI0008F9B494|nr:PREDICTED: putative inorganic phosphate cotransporter isoform X2 [Bemisia tabaci]